MTTEIEGNDVFQPAYAYVISPESDILNMSCLQFTYYAYSEFSLFTISTVTMEIHTLMHIMSPTKNVQNKVYIPVKPGSYYFAWQSAMPAFADDVIHLASLDDVILHGDTCDNIINHKCEYH